jgi:hypothetical protein
MDEHDVPALAKELQLLVGHGLTAVRLNKSPRLAALPRWGLDDTAEGSILRHIRASIRLIQDHGYISALNRSLSPREIAGSLLLLLRFTDESKRMTAFSRRKRVLASLTMSTDDSTVDWWRRAAGPEYELMTILARQVLSLRAETPAYVTSNQGRIDFEDSTVGLKRNAPIYSHHIMGLTALTDGFGTVGPLRRKRPRLDEYGHLSIRASSSDVGISTSHSSAERTDRTGADLYLDLFFHFGPLGKGESLAIEWEAEYWGIRDSTGEVDLWDTFAFNYPVVVPQHSLAVICDPVKPIEHLTYYEVPLDSADDWRRIRQGTFVRTGGKDKVTHVFRDLSPDKIYGVTAYPLQEDVRQRERDREFQRMLSNG